MAEPIDDVIARFAHHREAHSTTLCAACSGCWPCDTAKLVAEIKRRGRHVHELSEALAEAQRLGLAGVAAGPQATPGQVLYDGPTSPPFVGHADEVSVLHLSFDRPAGTHVRVVAVPTDHKDPT